MTEQTNNTASEEVNYFEIGDSTNIVVSASSLKYINPTEGGCPEAFIDFLDKGGKVNTKYTELGSLVHSFLEDKDNFIIEDIDRPSTEMQMAWVTEVKKDLQAIDLSEIDNPNTITLILQVAVKAKERLGIYSTTKDPVKIAEKFKIEILPYLKFLVRAEGKVALTKSQKTAIDKIGESLSLNPAVCDLALAATNEKQEVFNERVLLWTRNLDDFPHKMKCKVDKVIIDHENKVITIIDYKTTSDSLGEYGWTFQRNKVYRQFAFYKDAVAMFNPEGYEIKCIVIVMETTGYYNCAPFVVSGDWLERGSKEIKELLRRIQFHTESAEWRNSMEAALNNGYLKLPSTSELRA